VLSFAIPAASASYEPSGWYQEPGVVADDRDCDRHHMQSVMISAISADVLTVRHSSSTGMHISKGNPGGNQPARRLAKEKPDMLTISSAASSDDFSIQVLKQMAWLQQELAKAGQRGLDVAELSSIRGAILKSLEELKTLDKFWIEERSTGEWP
jgi:hypothetical protein